MAIKNSNFCVECQLDYEETTLAEHREEYGSDDDLTYTDSEGEQATLYCDQEGCEDRASSCYPSGITLCLIHANRYDQRMNEIKMNEIKMNDICEPKEIDEAIYTYLFIAEMDSDVKKIRTLMKGIGKVRKLRRLLNPVYMEEFECVCGQTIYQIKTEMLLRDLADMWRDKIPDSHYCYQSLNYPSIFTGERYLVHDNATTIQAETLQQEVVSNNQMSVQMINIMDEFQKFLGALVIYNDDNKYGRNCDFVVIPKCCPMKDGGKQGWVNCGKCIIEYNCENYGTPKFRDFIKAQGCRTVWLYPSQMGVWVNKKM